MDLVVEWAPAIKPRLWPMVLGLNFPLLLLLLHMLDFPVNKAPSQDVRYI